MAKQLKVQKYLKDKVAKGLTNLEAFQSLNAELGIKIKVYDSPEDRMVLLDYDQNESPKTDPVVIECRSLILCLDTFELVSQKFNRFFNLGENPEYYSDFRFEGSFVMEKADGSLIGIYNRKGLWQISTRGMAKAEGEHVTGGTFREKVLNAFGFQSEEAFQRFFNAKLNPRNTFIFEYISPENRIVTPYSSSEMVLLCINNRGKELGFDTMRDLASFFSHHGLRVRLPKIYDAAKDFAELAKIADSLKNLEEGFVVWDPWSGKRVKIKSKTYLLAHKLRGESAIPTRKNLLSLVLEGEAEEFLAYFPEWSEAIGSIKKELMDFEKHLMEVWSDVCNIEDQKEFALRVKDFRWAGFLFEAKKKKSSPVAVFRQSDLSKRLRVFGV